VWSLCLPHLCELLSDLCWWWCQEWVSLFFVLAQKFCCSQALGSTPPGRPIHRTKAVQLKVHVNATTVRLKHSGSTILFFWGGCWLVRVGCKNYHAVTLWHKSSSRLGPVLWTPLWFLWLNMFVCIIVRDWQGTTYSRVQKDLSGTGGRSPCGMLLWTPCSLQLLMVRFKRQEWQVSHAHSRLNKQVPQEGVSRNHVPQPCLTNHPWIWSTMWYVG